MKNFFMVFIILILPISSLNAQYNCGNLPDDVGDGICYGYAMARAFGSSGSSAATYRPGTSWLSGQYFSFHTGTNFKVGDIVEWGPQNAPSLTASMGHVAYVIQIDVENKPDGDIQPSAAGIYTDEDPIETSDWSHVWLAEVNGDGGNENASIRMDVVDSREQAKASHPTYGPIVYRGYHRLFPEYKCTIAFSNSFGSGHIWVGKDEEGSYLNWESGFSDLYTHNATIPAKAEASHTVDETNGILLNGGREKAFTHIPRKSQLQLITTM